MVTEELMALSDIDKLAAECMKDVDDVNDDDDDEGDDADLLVSMIVIGSYIFLSFINVNLFCFSLTAYLSFPSLPLLSFYISLFLPYLSFPFPTYVILPSWLLPFPFSSPPSCLNISFLSPNFSIPHPFPFFHLPFPPANFPEKTSGKQPIMPTLEKDCTALTAIN